MLVGLTLVFDQASPPPVYVPGVSPPLDPNATYASLASATFTLRLRAEEGLCLIAIINLRLCRIPFNYQMQNQLAYLGAQGF